MLSSGGQRWLSMLESSVPDFPRITSLFSMKKIKTLYLYERANSAPIFRYNSAAECAKPGEPPRGHRGSQDGDFRLSKMRREGGERGGEKDLGK